MLENQLTEPMLFSHYDSKMTTLAIKQVLVFRSTRTLMPQAERSTLL
jgi:hypothetical protein